MKIVILDDWEHCFSNKPVLTQLNKQFAVEVYNDKPTEKELVDRLKKADIIIPIRERTKFTKNILKEISHIKLIAQTGGGLAHIDMEEANRLKIPVATTPGGSKAVIELIFCFILALSKKIIPLNKELEKGHWPEIIGSSLEKKTIGIIGLGKIGSGVAKIAKVFDMKVIAWGPTLTEERANEQGVEYSNLDVLLKESHFVTVNVRLVPETTLLLTERHFNLMRSDAFLINTSRGKVVDEEALYRVLKERQIAGAGLDVFTQEPLNPNHPFRDLSNVILSPHIGWKTDAMFDLFLTEAISNINSYFVDKEPRRIVNSSAIDLNM